MYQWAQYKPRRQGASSHNAQIAIPELNRKRLKTAASSQSLSDDLQRSITALGSRPDRQSSRQPHSERPRKAMFLDRVGTVDLKCTGQLTSQSRIQPAADRSVKGYNPHAVDQDGTKIESSLGGDALCQAAHNFPRNGQNLKRPSQQLNTQSQDICSNVLHWFRRQARLNCTSKNGAETVASVCNCNDQFQRNRQWYSKEIAQTLSRGILVVLFVHTLCHCICQRVESLMIL
mmetsp:Transcript_6328/g.13700  ORF Transcript_6328/g.13700 Transcript_6328/m.13700 type:complete len:232 (+) Transcript_6328:1334-2029(+)